MNQVTEVDIKSDDDFTEQEEIRRTNEKLRQVIKRYEEQRDKQPHIQEFYGADKSKGR